MAIDIAKRQADRMRVMRAVYDAADGITSEVVRTAPTIQRQLALSNQELEAACDYLVGKGLIKPVATIDDSPTYIAVQLTHRGVAEMEDAISSPNTPTRHLPAGASIVQIFNSTVIGSPIQNASPAGQQTTDS